MALRLSNPRFVASATTPAQCPAPAGPEVAFAGRSNVGKSSLLNTLLGQPLARTSSTPGRTRLLNFFAADLPGGRPLGLVDLPGYGYAKVAKSERAAWRRMIEGYVKHREALAAMVIIVDARRGPEVDEAELLEWLVTLPRPVAPVVVATKLDKLGKAERHPALAAVRAKLELARPPLGFSAETGEGAPELLKLLADLVQPR